MLFFHDTTTSRFERTLRDSPQRSAGSLSGPYQRSAGLGHTVAGVVFATVLGIAGAVLLVWGLS